MCSSDLREGSADSLRGAGRVGLHEQTPHGPPCSQLTQRPPGLQGILPPVTATPLTTQQPTPRHSSLHHNTAAYTTTQQPTPQHISRHRRFSSLVLSSSVASPPFSSCRLQGNVKLAKFGLYHMTDRGADVDFPIG